MIAFILDKYEINYDHIIEKYVEGHKISVLSFDNVRSAYCLHDARKWVHYLNARKWVHYLNSMIERLDYNHETVSWSCDYQEHPDEIVTEMIELLHHARNSSEIIDEIMKCLDRTIDSMIDLCRNAIINDFIKETESGGNFRYCVHTVSGDSHYSIKKCCLTFDDNHNFLI